jgi:hypothetical protein
MKWITLVCVTVVLAGCQRAAPQPTPPLAAEASPATPSDPTTGGDPSPQQVFEKRILPIFRSPDPSSCVQCHLAGVELKNYILPSYEKTFQSLRDQGLKK